MAASLIINADDFGLTRGVNRSIAELHAAGALTSATLMANSAAFDDAVEIAKANPDLGVGCHVVLTDGTPVSKPEDIPSLLGPDGRTFRPSLRSFHLDVLRGQISSTDIEREATAQIERLQSHGIRVTHIDTHKHTHIMPQVARPLLSVAQRLGVRAIRNPFERSWSLHIGRSALSRRLQVAAMARLRPRFLHLPQIASGAVMTTDGTLGISATGSLDATILRDTLTAIPNGTWELVCHPGYNDNDLDAITTRLRSSREIEHKALRDFFTLRLLHNPPKLIHFGNLD